MATLLHHIQPWMQRSIAEAEEQIEKKVAQQMERRIQAVHQRLDAFELKVLACPAVTIDLTTLQVDVPSLRADIDAILDMRVPEHEAAPAELAEDTVLSEHAKRHWSRESEETRSWKKDRTDMEVTRRASLLDEESRQIRARELPAGASSSRFEDVERSTIEGAYISVGTTDGGPTIEGAGSEKPDPLAC
ncbi:uncharacterized protein LOC114074437 [Solanum pennellii]|uniref:Uncharacterized protein LOC114074437 n=1 Tax=Solanum pennellii TaxID=28526 RepID=A0ABM1UXJ4_SOLPN|nr:uncharacterized protein LOC114074437 [Solanum pennellii]